MTEQELRGVLSNLERLCTPSQEVLSQMVRSLDTYGSVTYHIWDGSVRIVLRKDISKEANEK